MSIENVEPQQWIVTELLLTGEEAGNELFLTVCPNFLAVDGWLASHYGKWATAQVTNRSEQFLTGEQNLLALFRKWTFRYDDGTVRQARGFMGFINDWSHCD